jgi:hypothetical protein
MIPKMLCSTPRIAQPRKTRPAPHLSVQNIVVIPLSFRLSTYDSTLPHTTQARGSYDQREKKHMRLYLLPLFLVFLALAAIGPGPGPFALASSGDRSDEFQRCLAKCTRETCADASADDGIITPRRRPLALRLTRWTCADDCKYACMHALTDLALESGVRVQQYYGKWPFWRLAGMQEPASVAFSIANLLMHVLGADWLRRGVHPAHPMQPFYLTWAYLSINAWAWSAVFHTRGAYSTIPLPPPFPHPPPFLPLDSPLHLWGRL